MAGKTLTVAKKTKALETLPCIKYFYGDSNISLVPQISQLKLPTPTPETQLQLSLWEKTPEVKNLISSCHNKYLSNQI